METIIGALISAVAAIVVCVISSSVQHSRVTAEIDKQNALLNQELGHLRKEVERHNSIVERTVELEKFAKVFEEKIAVANRRIDELEKKVESNE